MFKVSEIAKRTGVTVDTIRHYTKKGLLLPLRDPKNAYQLYSAADVSRMRFIHQAKRLGFTLTEIEEIVSDARQGRSPCPRVRDIIQARIKENRCRLEELNTLQERMEKAVEKWKSLPNGIPDGDSVCYLIEGEAEDEDNRGA